MFIERLAGRSLRLFRYVANRAFQLHLRAGFEVSSRSWELGNFILAFGFTILPLPLNPWPLDQAASQLTSLLGCGQRGRAGLESSE